MDDASGHYASGFFYGNNYWMGSMSLCKAIYHDDDEEDRIRKEGAKNSGLPFAKAHLQSYTSVYNENPPFIPGFYIIKMLLNETYPTSVVSIHSSKPFVETLVRIIGFTNNTHITCATLLLHWFFYKGMKSVLIPSPCENFRYFSYKTHFLPLPDNVELPV